MSVDDGSSWLGLPAAALLLLANAFFVASEFAIVKVRPTRLRELIEAGDRRAATALHISERLDAYLSANQLGITLASLGLGWLGEPAVASLFEPLTHGLVAPGSLLSHTLASVLGFSLITFLHVVVGELAPKSLAIQLAERTALWCARPLHLFFTVMYPVIWLLNTAANLTLRAVGLQPAQEADLPHSEAEIRLIVSRSQEQGVLEEHERELVENIFDYSDRVAREIMTPRTDVTLLSAQDPFPEIVRQVIESGFTRYPVYDGDKDQIIGIVHIRDVLRAQATGAPPEGIRSLLRPALIVPETLPIKDLTKKFQQQRTHMAVVVDEYGVFVGVVTLEDMVEELFGDFADELEEPEPAAITRTGDTWLVDASLRADEVWEALGIEAPEEIEGVDTIGGYVFTKLGKKPEVGDEVSIGAYRFRVEEVDGLRIARLAVRLAPPPPPDPPVAEEAASPSQPERAMGGLHRAP